MKTGIGSGIEFQPKSEIESIFVFSIVEIIEVFNICFDFMKMSKSIIKYYPSGLNGLNWLKVNGNKYYQYEEYYSFRTKPIKIITHSQFQFSPSDNFEGNSFLFENPTQNTFEINITYYS